MADNDIDRKVDICEANSLTESRDITHYDAVDSGNVEGDDLGSIKPQPKIITTSRISGEHASETESSGSKHRSILIFEGDSQFREVNMQSPVGIIVTPFASFEKETGLSRSNEIEHKEKWGNQLHFVKDGFHAITHDPQRRTESLCSNSLSVVHPVSSLSEHSYQKTSKEAYSFKNFSGCMDDLNSKGFDCRLEEHVIANSESGSTAQIDHNKAARNARAKNGMKIFPIAGSCSSLHTNKIDTLMQDHEISHKQDHETATSGDGVQKVTDRIDNFNCSFKTEGNIRSSAEYSNHPLINSSEGTTNSEISRESETMFLKGKSLDMCMEMMGKMGNESSASSMTGLGENAMKNFDTFVTGLDLNEGINACGMNYCIQPVVGTVSSHSVIHVVAKAGIPRGLPMIPLKFEGELNWKGSAETSAFHSAAHSKVLDRKPGSRNYIPQGFSGIDLNVAAEDSHAIGMHPKHEEISSTSTLPENSCSDVSLKQAERLSIDLNCLYDTANNLDADTSLGDASNNVQWIGQGHQSWGNIMSGSKNHEKREFDFISRIGFDGLCAMQQGQVSNHAHAQQYLVASPNALQPLEPMQRVALLHPRLPYLSRTLPPQTHSKGSFYFGSTSHLPLCTHHPSTSPYTRYHHPQEHRIFPELLNPDTVPASIGTPHLTHGKSIDNTTTSTSTVNVKIKDNLPTRGIKMDEATSFMFLTKNPINEHFKSSNQETWSATSMKRKEPEGGLNCFQGKSLK